jgi:hypothetical protein
MCGLVWAKARCGHAAFAEQNHAPTRIDPSGIFQVVFTVTTLAQHYESTNVSVICNGRACGRQADLDLPALAERFGWDTPLTALRPRLRCSACGSRDVRWSVSGYSDPERKVQRARRQVIAESRAAGRAKLG